MASNQAAVGSSSSSNNSPDGRHNNADTNATEKRWTPAYREASHNNSIDKTKSKSTIAAAEPQHRAGAQGVSSGISLRDFPKSNVQQVREICLHYVKKVSGKYENNKMATRYIHQMADEVIKQLTGVSTQIKRFENEPEVFQALLDEWNEHFPPSLGAIGTPKAISRLVSKQKDEIDRLSELLRDERSNRTKDVGELVSSLDTQLQAAKISILAERNQFNKTLKGKDKESEKEKQVIRDENQIQIERLLSQQQVELRELLNKIDELQTKSSIDRQNAERELELCHANHRNEFEKMRQTFMQEKRLDKDKIASLESKLKSMSLSIADLSNKSAAAHQSQLGGLYNYSSMHSNDDDAESIDLNDNESMLDPTTFSESDFEEVEVEVEEQVEVEEEVTDSEEEEEEDDEDDEAEQEEKSDVDPEEKRRLAEEDKERRSLIGLLDSIGSIKKKGGKKKKKKTRKVMKTVKVMKKIQRKKEKPKSQNKLKLSGPIGKAIKTMKEKISYLTEQNLKNSEYIASSQEIKKVLEDLNSKKDKELRELRVANQSLQYAVQENIKQNHLYQQNGVNFDEMKRREYQPVVLHHTPHFLANDRSRYADVNGGKKSKVGGVKGVGSAATVHPGYPKVKGYPSPNQF